MVRPVYRASVLRCDSRGRQKSEQWRA